MAEANDEGEQPDNGEGSGDGVAAADEPGDEGDDPAADDAAPEDVTGAGIGRVYAHADKRMESGRRESFCAGGKQREQERSGDVGGQNDGPEAGGFEEVSALGEDEGDGIDGIFSEELGAADNDGQKPDGVEEQGYEVNPLAVAEVASDDGNTEAGQAHGESAGDTGEGQCPSGTLQFAASVARDLLVDFCGCGAVEIALLRLGRFFFPVRWRQMAGQRHDVRRRRDWRAWLDDGRRNRREGLSCSIGWGAPVL